MVDALMLRAVLVFVGVCLSGTPTDYVRVALGHLVLDEMWSKCKFDSEEELMKTAYRSYAQRGFGRCYFKE